MRKYNEDKDNRGRRGRKAHRVCIFKQYIWRGEVREEEERVEINIDFVFHYTQWSTHLQHTIPVADE